MDEYSYLAEYLRTVAVRTIFLTNDDICGGLKS